MASRPRATRSANSPIYSYGHRNVQGLAWDHSGQLYASEFGQNRYDELNRIEPGKNYGWPIVEGMGSDPQYVNPVATWATSDASPSGLAIAGDRAYLACLRGTKLYRIGLDGNNAQVLLDASYGRPSSSRRTGRCGCRRPTRTVAGHLVRTTTASFASPRPRSHPEPRDAGPGPSRPGPRPGAGQDNYDYPHLVAWECSHGHDLRAVVPLRGSTRAE
jgi:hypothetical protein